LPESAGTCVVNLRYVDAENTTLKITSTATFADVTDTVSLTLTMQRTQNRYKDLEDATFGLPEYEERADELDTLTSGGVVPLYESNSNDNSSRNETDEDTLDKKIDANSTMEARWTNVDVNGTGSHNAGVLGTQRYPINTQTDPDTDNRRFMVPLNGRIMIDPLEDGGTANDGDDDNNNAKISSLAIDNTADKNVLFRLASGSAAVGVGATKNRSDTYRNSLLLFNFTDNKDNTDILSYEVDGRAQSYTWHPDNWNSLDVYVQSGSQVTSNILLGPFGHKFDSYLDYRSFGNFVDHWHGTTYKEYVNAWPYVSASTNNGAYLGMPVFALDYGKNAHFWILDGNPDLYFRVMQGVNIIEGSIYSNRETKIGGALLRDGTAGKTKEKVNEAAAGYSLDTSRLYTLYVDATSRYDQLIYNTDIILKAPSGTGTAKSTISRPYTYRDRPALGIAYLGHVEADENYDPTMTIKGGTIYVGERQSLTIEGSILDNMWISPDKIVVAEGGTLTLAATSYPNVFTDIFVDGGTLVIESGAKMKGNIHVYNDGTVDIKGPFWLSTLGPTGPDDPPQGLFIYGEGAIDDEIITASGHLLIPSGIEPPRIDNREGSYNSIVYGTVHLVGGGWLDLANAPNMQVENIAFFLCSNHDPETGMCMHSYEDTGGDGSGSGGTGGTGGTGSGGTGSGGTGGSSGGRISGWIVGSFGDN
jgi:uncharacterized membrane protein YgcG